MSFSKIFFTSLILGIGMPLLSNSPAQAQYFIRGDVNCDGLVDSSDVFFLDSLMNHGGPLPACLDAADVNDDGLFFSIADMVYLLRSVDLGLALPPPFPNCGTDPTFDGYTCSVSCCTCTFKPGDTNADDKLSLSDIIVLVNHVFKGGAKPDPACRGDADGDGMLDLTDLVYLVNFVFRAGPDPIPSGVCCQPT
ncbi:MAG: hypothetical protein RBG1_1C00001G0187 [candidate division Zixibacteria bacterium RBG-1]|nr:MAG: hypothetical protein RBG1_1C00001G0187 [candidate division Zixibacteria bacterium RBG-1]OGC83975.1 MAG: hypothetical protein A2V73_07465 [candidate division Zixibacteria bacterium RBG_19FT_COMBO_42_43]